MHFAVRPSVLPSLSFRGASRPLQSSPAGPETPEQRPSSLPCLPDQVHAPSAHRVTAGRSRRFPETKQDDDEIKSLPLVLPQLPSPALRRVLRVPFLRHGRFACALGVGICNKETEEKEKENSGEGRRARRRSKTLFQPPSPGGPSAPSLFPTITNFPPPSILHAPAPCRPTCASFTHSTVNVSLLDCTKSSSPESPRPPGQRWLPCPRVSAMPLRQPAPDYSKLHHAALCRALFGPCHKHPAVADLSVQKGPLPPWPACLLLILLHPFLPTPLHLTPHSLPASSALSRPPTS